jgi:hypothetical protein
VPVTSRVSVMVRGSDHRHLDGRGAARAASSSPLAALRVLPAAARGEGERERHERAAHGRRGRRAHAHAVGTRPRVSESSAAATRASTSACTRADLRAEHVGLGLEHLDEQHRSLGEGAAHDRERLARGPHREARLARAAFGLAPPGEGRGDAPPQLVALDLRLRLGEARLGVGGAHERLVGAAREHRPPDGQPERREGGARVEVALLVADARLRVEGRQQLGAGRAGERAALLDERAGGAEDRAVALGRGEQQVERARRRAGGGERGVDVPWRAFRWSCPHARKVAAPRFNNRARAPAVDACGNGAEHRVLFMDSPPLARAPVRSERAWRGFFFVA